MPVAGFFLRARILRWLLAVVAAGLILYWFPLVRIVRLDEAEQQAAREAFQPKEFAEQFWSGQLLPSLDRAADAKTLMAAIREDRRAAKSRFAHSLGMGSVYCYFVRGEGRVVRIDAESVGLRLSDNEGEPDVLICKGPIFGNAIRDGANLVDVSLFPNSQDFNRVSQEINRIVETRVLPPFLDRVEQGKTVEFVGCAEIIDEQRDLDPLRLVPISLRIRGDATGGATRQRGNAATE